MRRTLILAVVVVALGAVVATTARTDPTPELYFDSTVPADLRELGADTWSDFLAAHQARVGCIPPATLRAAWELDTRGEYRPATATVVVRVPGTAATLRNEMIHEFAHHVDFACPEQEELRPAFLDAQGFSAGTDWRSGDSWESTPSEQYAEATVEVVLGRRSHHGNVRLTEEAVAVVRSWGLGS